MPKVPKIKDGNHLIRKKEFRCQKCGIEYTAFNFQNSHLLTPYMKLYRMTNDE